MMLRADNIHKSFGGVKALDGVSIQVPAGTVVGLVGPNGSGKSTLFSVVSGFAGADAGETHFDGTVVTDMRPYEIARLGLCRTFQFQPAAQHLTVEESVLAAFPAQHDRMANALFSRGAIRRHERALREQGRDILRQFEIEHIAQCYCGEISGGQQKLVAIARAVASGAKMILLDEPAAGVNPVLRDRIAGFIAKLKDELGKTVLLVEHDMRFVGMTCDYVFVLEAGRIIAQGTYDEIKSDARVLDAYLGRSVTLR